MTTTARGRPRFSTRDRRVVFLMVVVAFVVGYGAAQISHTLTFARKSLGLTESGMFWIFGITRAASLLGVIFAIVADRRGRRTPFLIAFTIEHHHPLYHRLAVGAKRQGGPQERAQTRCPAERKRGSHHRRCKPAESTGADFDPAVLHEWHEERGVHRAV